MCVRVRMYDCMCLCVFMRICLFCGIAQRGVVDTISPTGNPVFKDPCSWPGPRRHSNTIRNLGIDKISHLNTYCFVQKSDFKGLFELEKS